MALSTTARMLLRSTSIYAMSRLSLSVSCLFLSISVTRITQNRVANHEKHVVHLIYKTRGLEKVPDVKLIENLIEQTIYYKPLYPSGQRKLSVKQSPSGFVGSNPTGGT